MKDPAYTMSLDELYKELTDEGRAEVEGDFIQIKRAFFSWTVFVFAAAFFPIASFYIYPAGEDVATWFQRSGAISVVFGLLADIRASKLKLLSFSESSPFLFGPIYTKRKYSSKAQWADRVSLLVVILGTVIWGYGDLVYRLLLP